MDSILKLIPYGENIGADTVRTNDVVRILERLERVLEGESIRWSEVSLLVLADSKLARSDKHQHDSAESVKHGLEQFCGDRNWYPSLIGTSVFSSFFRFREERESDISDGLLFLACVSAVVPKIPVAWEITDQDADRREAGARALREAVGLLRHKMQETLGVDVPPRTVTDNSMGLIFTTGSGHIELEKGAGGPSAEAVTDFVDFKDCYSVGQELVRAARELNAMMFGGCATNRTPAQLQGLYFSEDIGARTHFRSTYRHGAVAAFMPYQKAQPHLRHPYRRTKDDRLDLEFSDREKYAEGRCFYVRRINGRPPVEFLADYWDYTVEQLVEMSDIHHKVAIPSKPGAHLVTIASSLNRFDDNAWPNVPIWLDHDEHENEILLRLVRAEAEDGNYYLMEMKPEYLSDNAKDLMTAVKTGYSQDVGVVSFLCESRKYVLNDNKSNAEAEVMVAEAPSAGAVVGIYLNGEYSTGAPESIGYHNYSQISAILSNTPLRSLPLEIAQARRASAVQIFACHSSRDKPAVREFLAAVEKELPTSTTWLDEKEILVGDVLRTEVMKAVKQTSTFFVAFLSDRSIGSEWVQKELKWAVEAEMEGDHPVILPVVFEDDDATVMKSLRASWKEELVEYLDERLQLRIHDFTEEEMAAKAKRLAADIARHLSERDDGGEPEFHPGLRPTR